MKKLATVAMLAVLLAALAACSGNPNGPSGPGGGGVVTSPVSVTPQNFKVYRGTFITLSASGGDGSVR